MSEKNDRDGRITDPKSGVYGSSSQDLVRLSFMLTQHSRDYAHRYDGNVSVYAVAGIPILFSALRALLIEANSGMFGVGANDRMSALAKMTEVGFIKRYYAVSDDLIKNFQMAYEVRNEIAHPSHLPAGTQTGTPEYLSELRSLNLLQSGIWISQLQSHRLFCWASGLFEKIAEVVISAHHSDSKAATTHLESWKRYREYVL